MLKKVIKTVLIILGAFVVLILLFGLMIKYEMSWRLSEVGREKSPDGRYNILFQSVGEADFPFGQSHAKVTVYDGKNEITSFREDISDDGAAFRPDNYSVEWTKYGVVITFKGSEQADKEVEVFYDGRESFEGYTNGEIEEILKERYGISNVEKISKQGDGYRIRADGIDFRADNKMAFHDSYRQEQIKTITEGLFPGTIQRGLSWDIKEGGSPADVIYTPVISMNGPGKQDIDSFCHDICEWLTYCFEKVPYEEGREAYTGFIPVIPGFQNVKFNFDEYELEGFTEDPTDFYNTLYLYLNRFMDHEYDALMGLSGQSVSGDETGDSAAEDSAVEVSGGFDSEVTEETVRAWAAYDPGPVYDFPDGREYALIPVDRALGSSYYVLLSYETKGDIDSARLVNQDPFNGSGGEAGFITFMEDGRTGFASLTYNGGSDGLLFMTSDAGESFSEVLLPSPEIALPDGTLYNPFVVPEAAWEESGVIYLRIGQGTDGDYYDKELDDHPVGIYRSEDNGKTFTYCGPEGRSQGAN
ncbi:MAG: hypothetical protein K6G42_09940 [Lachnospiraceae bacterium]|nr:hypothetical protein [Lachnospiraceae bacterium]